MKALITQSGQIGPFASITRTADDTGWLAGDCIYPDGVVGEATVSYYTNYQNNRSSTYIGQVIKRVECAA